jgi:hypothetical protein
MHRFLFLLMTALASVHAYAECRALHPSGKTVPVKEQSGETVASYALASWLPYGPPTIYYGKRFETLDPAQQRFVQRKECAHLSVPTVDEVLAACHALRQLRGDGLSTSEERSLGSWLASGGAAGFNYKGTAPAFWDAIVQCADKG